MGTHPIFESDFDCLTDKYKSDMLTIEGRQVQVELVSLSELGIQAIPNGLVIPNGLKRKLLDQLNWQEFVRLHCRRRNLGFSEQFLRQSSPDGRIIMDKSHTGVSGFDPEIQRGLADEGLKVSQIMTLMDPNLTNPCNVWVVLKEN